MINTVKQKSLMGIFNGIPSTEKTKDSLDKAYSMEKEAMDQFISYRVVVLTNLSMILSGSSNKATKIVSQKERHVALTLTSSILSNF